MYPVTKVRDTHIIGHCNHKNWFICPFTDRDAPHRYWILGMDKSLYLHKTMGCSVSSMPLLPRGNRHCSYVSQNTMGYTRNSLQWRHNGLDGVSNHQPHHCLLNRLFGCRSKKTPKPRVTGLCAGNSPGTVEFPAQMASNAENVSIWWRHHVLIYDLIWNTYLFEGYPKNRQNTVMN